MNRFKDPLKLLSHILSHRTLHTITPKVLTVSCYANFYPVCYHDPKSGKITGLDVEIMQYFCKITGLALKLIEKESFDKIWFDVIRGVSDIAIGGIGISDKRTAPGMSWTIPYFYVFRTVIFNKKNPIHKFPGNVRGTIRGTRGSTGWLDGQLRLEHVGKLKFLKPGKTDEEDIRDLKAGKIQGLLRGSFVGKAITEREPELGMLSPWKIDPRIVSNDGEVFAYPTLCSSGIGQLMSVFLTEEIFTGELQWLVKKYRLD